MIIADWIAIGLAAFFALLGFIVGFGKGLRFFTGGFFGFIITLLICYCLGGIVLQFEFVQDLLDKFIGLLEGNGAVTDILLAIHLELIVYYIVLFIIVIILRVTVVKLIASIFEIDNVLIRFVNRILGMGLFVAALVLIAMIAFQIISLIGGDTLTGFQAQIAGSVVKLDWLFDNNPLMNIIPFITVEV